MKKINLGVLKALDENVYVYSVGIVFENDTALLAEVGTSEDDAKVLATLMTSALNNSEGIAAEFIDDIGKKLSPMIIGIFFVGSDKHVELDAVHQLYQSAGFELVPINARGMDAAIRCAKTLALDDD